MVIRGTTKNKTVKETVKVWESTETTVHSMIAEN